MELIDFDHSYITWQVPGGTNGRFNLEAMCEVKDLEEGTSSHYYLGSTVMACDVFGSGELFRIPPYSFTPIFSETQIRRVRFYEERRNEEDDVKNFHDLFEDVRFFIPKVQYKVLNDTESVIMASKSNQRLIGTTTTTTKDSRFTIKATFPIKHVNFNRNEHDFQVETGKVLHASGKGPVDIHRIDLAYVAFQEFERCEFLLMDPSSSAVGGKRSRFFRRTHAEECKISIFALASHN